MAKLTKTQQYAIQWLNSKDMTTISIADELGITEKSVVNFLEKNQQTNKNNNIKTATSSAGDVKNKNLMITKTSGKKNKGVTVMTPEASVVGDESKKNYISKSHRDKTAIFKPIQD